jgi:hypothetical protein
MEPLKKNDFSFEVDGQVFNKLWFLTDGIYPKLSCFVKTISKPLDRWGALYSIWQEAKRKEIERGFGMLKKKFGFLHNPFQMYYVEDIAEIVYCCFILHNMTVEERIISSDDSPESADFYDCIDIEDSIELEPCGNATGTAAALAYVQLEDDALQDRVLEINRLSQLGIDINDPLLTQRAKDVELLDIQTRLAHKGWKGLYNFEEHKRLQKEIIKELWNKYSFVE